MTDTGVIDMGSTDMGGIDTGGTPTGSTDTGSPDARLSTLLAALEAGAASHLGGPGAAVRALRDSGLLTAPLPAAAGTDGGLDGWRLMRALWALGGADLPLTRLYEGHVNAVQLVWAYGDAAQRERAARDAAAGQLFGVWNTEGQDPLRLEDGLRLQGAKTFASGAQLVTRPLVTAEGSAGRQLALLRVEAPETVMWPDSGSWQPLGMEATGSVRVDFTGSLLEPGDLIGAPGDYYRQPAFGGGALRFCAAQLGAAARVQSEVAAFLAAAGRAGDDVQALRLAAAAGPLEAAGLALRAAVRRGEQLGACPDGAALEAFLTRVSLVRGLTEDACLGVLEAAERAVGARGLLEPQPFSRLTRDLRMYLRQPAPDAARLQLGRWLLARGPLPGVWEEAWDGEPWDREPRAGETA